MQRPAHGWTARAPRTRWPLALAALGVLAAAWAAPAAAAGQPSAPTLTVSRLWNQGGRAGTWSPYVLTVHNGGRDTFTGTAVLIADAGNGRPLAEAFPEYDAAVVVAAGGQRALTVYAIEPGGGYRGELRDGQGRVVATAGLAATGGAGPAVAIVSDVPQVQQRLDALLRSQSQLDAAVSQFSSVQQFPADVVRLSGLNAVVLDQLDTGSLDQAQLRALADFVGLGGTLVVAGGAGARRTAGPLPAELAPMRPTGTGTASLAPLLELGGLAGDVTATVATGDLTPDARVGLAAPDGTPLLVERPYGAGEVVQLAFDPLAAPFDGRIDVAAAAWVQALERGLTGAAGSGSSQLAQLAFGNGAFFGGPPVGSGPGSAAGYPGYLDQALAEAPAVATPPFGLLAGLLAAYVVAVSALAYAVLRAVGRRGLLWVVVPVTAIACTAAAYVTGFGTRGSDFQVVQVQIERLAPGGVVETAEFDGVLAPRRGDVTLTAPSGALVTTARASFGPFGSGGDPGRISIASAPQITFPNVPVWDVRPVQTLTVGHDGAGGGAALPIETRLSLRNGRVRGQVVNHGSRAVRDLRLIGQNGQVALAPSLAPGATAEVDAPLSAGQVSTLGGKIGIAIPTGVFGPASARTAEATIAALAATEVAVRPGEWALIGRVDPTRTLRVGGERPRGTGTALVVEPARLLSADSATGAAPSRLVSSYRTPAGGIVEVFEQPVPQGLTGRVALATSVLPGRSPAIMASSLDVYDWGARTWRTVSSGSPAALTAGEVAGGVVRARVVSDGGGQVVLGLSDVP